MTASRRRSRGAHWWPVLLAALLAAPPVWAQQVAPAPAVATASAPLLLPDGGRYVGPLKDGLLDGQGRMAWPSGDRYEGGFARGHLQGGGRYTGNGFVYVGEFADGQMHGRGRMTRDDGTVYVGQFAHGRLEGQGRISLPGGMVYEGSFRRDQPAGKGRLIDPRGTTLEGRFDGYQARGPVVLSYPGGARYQGEVRDQVPHGQGVMTLPDRSVVSGRFAYGEVDGPATIRHANGAVYTGEVQRHLAHGVGERRAANGDIYRGRFVQGWPEGQGRLERVGHDAQVGYWRRGEYLGPQGDGTVDETPGLAPRNNEAALYNQQALLDKQLSALRPSEPGAAQLYALFVAGDGSQEVFRREAAFVDQLFARRFGTEGRSVSLVNSRSSTDRLPLATTRSIELALQALARRMDRERDLLFVFLTSHGSKTHELSLGMNGMALPDLPAATLGRLLKASGIRNQVVVVSACYSGGFVPALQGERTWVITAARADRTSFGCADENDFTYFGHALFKDALAEAPTLSAAVEQAMRRIAEWETRDAKAARPPRPASKAASALEHSEPQSVVDAAFRAEVDEWFRARSAARVR